STKSGMVMSAALLTAVVAVSGIITRSTDCTGCSSIPMIAAAIIERPTSKPSAIARRKTTKIRTSMSALAPALAHEIEGEADGQECYGQRRAHRQGHEGAGEGEGCAHDHLAAADVDQPPDLDLDDGQERDRREVAQAIAQPQEAAAQPGVE